MVDYLVSNRVAIITIGRPEARNAIDGAVATGIEHAIDRLEADPECWAGILTGEGPVFCAGADLRAIAAGQAASLRTARGGFAGVVSRDRTKPLIAAVDGPALAGGFEMVLACDLVVASRRAVFGLPEVKRSLVAAGGGLFRLPRTVGPKVAMELILTGDPIAAELAYEMGLVNVLVDPDQALEGARALAARIVANAPQAVWASRAVAARALSEDDNALWALTAEALAKVGKTEDFTEGPRAFIEKRPPVWTGR
ncbi:MAG TPA: crotonase/enoyl-CoA hydratase family protein [Acidimicrobiales bacterium]|nr:crotonase/enoyl-CoA hydratase family protein [Acidimicrobiales bacterium]